ncbi:energy transducer TonB [Oxalobacter paraformigenes]|nr:energy transducer TonB [Oxalobacter paraformigenes]
MAAHAPNHFPLRHIDRLPQPLVRGLATAVLFMHGILIVAALRSIPLVELDGNAGGGNGSSRGNKALFVSVLQGSPSLSGTLAERQVVRSAEKPASVKKKKQPELIATTAATQKTSPEIKTTRMSPVEHIPAAAESKTIPDPHFFLPGQWHSSQESNTVGSAATGNGTKNGKGSGYGEGKGTGRGQSEGEGTGSGIGSSGTGNGIPRSVSLSRLKYKRAVKPDYPARSIQKHESGQVNVRVIVDTTGRVHDARVVLSSGFSRLDEAALKAARRSTFDPYTEHGCPLFAMAIIPYRFNLNGK